MPVFAPPSERPWLEVDQVEAVLVSLVADLVVPSLALPRRDYTSHLLWPLEVAWPAQPCGSSSSACPVAETKLQGEAFYQAEPFHAQKELLGQPLLLLCFLWSAHSSALPSHFPGAQVNASLQEQLACEASSLPAQSPSRPAVHWAHHICRPAWIQPNWFDPIGPNVHTSKEWFGPASALSSPAVHAVLKVLMPCQNLPLPASVAPNFLGQLAPSHVLGRYASALEAAHFPPSCPAPHWPLLQHSLALRWPLPQHSLGHPQWSKWLPPRLLWWLLVGPL